MKETSQRFRIKMTPSQSPFANHSNSDKKQVLPNPFEGRVTQEELDHGFFSLSLDNIIETYSQGQMQTLLDEMYCLSDEVETACINHLKTKK